MSSVGTVHGVEGIPLPVGFATMTDHDPLGTAAEYSVTAEWGDGSSGPVALGETSSDAGTGAHFVLVTNHAYHYSGTFVMCFTIADLDSRAAVGGCTSAVIDEAPLALQGITSARTNPYCADVASFTDGNPFPFIGDFEATIDWGDGTSSAGFIAETQSGGPGTQAFTVQGCHTYADLGPHTLTTTVTDVPFQATVTSTAWVYGATEGGSFVVGDGSAAAGPDVTFWDASWAKDNAVSGGAAPDSFKGFAPASSPVCGGTWAASPGDSGAPPATVPSYTTMLVSSDIRKHGDEIDGNTVHVALVHTDGTPGSGTIVFMIC